MQLDRSKLLPLEKFLLIHSENINAFPRNQGNYFGRYESIKNWLYNNYYRFNGTGSSINPAGQEGRFMTDHGIDHFNDVISHAGQLIGLDEHGNFVCGEKITPYEAFYILVAILLHDAGNAAGREGHSDRVYEIASQLETILSSKFERNIICRIAEVHGGEVVVSDDNVSKDTIGLSDLKDEEFLQNKVRAKQIAGLVRFADEICETTTRSASSLLKFGNIAHLAQNSVPAHAYANSIMNSRYDIKAKTLFLDFRIDKSNAISDLCPENEIYLFNVILDRLEKMNCERIYCNKYMLDIAYIYEVRVSLKVDDDRGRVVFNESIILEDKGYPNAASSLKELYPNLQAVNVISKINNGGK